MIPATNIRVVESCGVRSKGQFFINPENAAHIMGILRDSMYTRKELACMREYGGNGWDAHRSIGDYTTPLKIHIPTPTDPTLIIRDFGPGMSEDEVFTIFPSYGASTKRMSNEMVGTLGIGSKSGFAYTDSFSITSWNGGTKSVYVAYLDESDRGEINKIHEEPCGDETGLEIKIAVQPRDVDIFQREATDLFKYMEPRPNINIPLPNPKRHVTPHGFVTKMDDEEWGNHRDWVAVMGCIPYRLDLKQIQPELEEMGLFHTLYRISGGIHFEIGEVQISANREELKYSDKTKAAVVTKIKALMDAYIEDTLEALKADNISGWEKRIRALDVSDTLGLPIPKKYQIFTVNRVTLYDDAPPKTFVLKRGEVAITQITVYEGATAYWRDTDKSLKGYYLSNYSVVLDPKPGMTKEEVIAEFEALCLKAGLDGMGVDDISTLHWSAPMSKRGRTPNKKHSVQTFVLKERSYYCHPHSRNWEVEKREPQDSDVYVIIKEFKAVGWDKFFDEVAKDRRMAKDLGVEMPPIYGYKTTAKKPATKQTCKGTPYNEWRRSFFRGLVTARHREIVRLHGWSQLFYRQYSRYSYRSQGSLSEVLKSTSGALGPRHPLTMLLREVEEGSKKYSKVSKENRNQALRIMQITQARVQESEAEQAREALYQRYPLFRTVGFDALREADTDEWYNYFRLVDRDLTRNRRLLLTDGKNRG